MAATKTTKGLTTGDERVLRHARLEENQEQGEGGIKMFRARERSITKFKSENRMT
jgi:hypothetical protein